MKRLRVILLLASIPAVLFLVGPRIPLNVDNALPDLPEIGALETFIAERESKVLNIRDGLSSGILWANPEAPAKTPLSVVYLHGFNASRNEIEPVPSEVARRLGANFFALRFSGSGTDPEDKRNVSILDWSRDALFALSVGRALGERVIIIGTSNGAAWTTWLASLPLEDSRLTSLILVSPHFHPADDRVRMLTHPWARQILPRFMGEYREVPTFCDEHEHGWYTRYPFVALFPLMGTVLLLERTELENIDLPVLTLYNPDDPIVSIPAMYEATARLPHPSNRMIALELSPEDDPHVITGRIRAPSTVETSVNLILNFLREVGAVRI